VAYLDSLLQHYSPLEFNRPMPPTWRVMFIVVAADGNDWWNLWDDWSPSLAGWKNQLRRGKEHTGCVYIPFYRAMLRRARWCDSKSSVRLSVCPSVRPSLTLKYDFHTGWNTSKITLRPNSLRLLLWLTPYGWSGAKWCNGNTHKIRLE